MKAKPYSIFWDDPIWPFRKETGTERTTSAEKENDGKQSRYSETNVPDEDGLPETSSPADRETGMHTVGKRLDRSDGRDSGSTRLSVGNVPEPHVTRESDMRSSVPDSGYPDTESPAKSGGKIRETSSRESGKTHNPTGGAASEERAGIPTRESLRAKEEVRTFAEPNRPVAGTTVSGRRTDRGNGETEKGSEPESLSRTGMSNRRDTTVSALFPTRGARDAIQPRTLTGFSDAGELPELLRPVPIRATAGERLWQHTEATLDGRSGQERPPRRESYPTTRRIVDEMIDSRLSQLRVYVLESDITEAQQAVRSVVEQASF